MAAKHAGEPASVRKWWQEPVIILAHQYDAVMSTEQSPAAIERLVRWKRSLGFEAEHLLLNHSMMEGSVGGDDAAAYLFKNRHGYRQDWLARYLPVAQQHGLRVIAYFNVHWFKTDTFPMDFYCLDSSGQPKVAYGSGYGVCPRGPRGVRPGGRRSARRRSGRRSAPAAYAGSRGRSRPAPPAPSRRGRPLSPRSGRAD